ncbi:MAG: hypothetical protein HY833_00600 [Candidatus Aenigmarchaeota archaeon]|nr:hypothetical protein [Candidatus Aenigmarchaeota archaeon]
MEPAAFAEYLRDLKSVMCDYCGRGLTSVPDDNKKPMGRVTLECGPCDYYTLNKGDVMGRASQRKYMTKTP